MADVVTTADEISPLETAKVRRYFAGAAITVGNLVYLDTAGKVQPADANALASSQAIGIAVAFSIRGATVCAANEAVDVCIWGPVWVGATAGMTIPGRAYVSATAGKFDQTVTTTPGEYPFIVGKAEAACILFINPQVTIPVVVPGP